MSAKVEGLAGRAKNPEIWAPPKIDFFLLKNAWFNGLGLNPDRRPFLAKS